MMPKAFKNRVIDKLKSSYPYHRDMANLRHFGPAEWPYFESRFCKIPCFQSLNPAARAQVAALPLSVTPDALSSGDSSLIEKTMLRSCDLIQCGYPTEGVLIAFALLDATIQDTLKLAMKQVGLSGEACDGLLRNTTISRIATFLDPILKLVSGHSLRDDQSTLFESVLRLNKLRNNAIHNGNEIDRSVAQECLCTAFDCLDYINSVLPHKMRLPPRPQFQFS